MDAFLESHAVILMADHAQTDVEHELPLAAALGADWRVLAPNAERPELAELAVSPTARAAAVYALAEPPRREQVLAGVRDRLRGAGGRRPRRPPRGGERPGPRGDRRARRRRASIPAGDAGDRPPRGRMGPGGRPRRAGARASRRPDRERRLPGRARPPVVGAQRAATPATSSSRSTTGYECVDWGGTESRRAAGATARFSPGTRSARCFSAGWSPASATRASSGRFATWPGSSATTSASVTGPRSARPTWRVPPMTPRGPGRPGCRAGSRPPGRDGPATRAPAPPTGRGASCAGSIWGPGSPRTGCSCSSSASSAGAGTSSTSSSSPLLTEALGIHHIAAAVLSFCVAVSNNFLLNRHWTFRATEGHAGFQAVRFFAVSVAGAGRQPRLPVPARRRRVGVRAARPGDRRGRGDAASTSSATSCGPSGWTSADPAPRRGLVAAALVAARSSSAFPAPPGRRGPRRPDRPPAPRRRRRPAERRRPRTSRSPPLPARAISDRPHRPAGRRRARALGPSRRDRPRPSRGRGRWTSTRAGPSASR